MKKKRVRKASSRVGLIVIKTKFFIITTNIVKLDNFTGNFNQIFLSIQIGLHKKPTSRQAGKNKQALLFVLCIWVCYLIFTITHFLSDNWQQALETEEILQLHYRKGPSLKTNFSIVIAFIFLFFMTIDYNILLFQSIVAYSLVNHHTQLFYGSFSKTFQSKIVFCKGYKSFLTIHYIGYEKKDIIIKASDI